MSELRLNGRAEVDALLWALDYASKAIETEPYQPLYLRLDRCDEEADVGDPVTIHLTEAEQETVSEALAAYRDDAPTDDLDAVLAELAERI